MTRYRDIKVFVQNFPSSKITFGLLYPKEGGTKIIQTARAFLPISLVSHARIFVNFHTS